jgi:hypothetical protein
MSKNINQFAIYTAKLFDILYDSFPVPINIDRNKIINEYLCFDKDKEIKELKTKQGIGDLVMAIEDNDTEKRDRVKKSLTRINEEVDSLETEKTNDRKNQISIFEGTMDFLLSEQLIRIS